MQHPMRLGWKPSIAQPHLKLTFHQSWSLHTGHQCFFIGSNRFWPATGPLCITQGRNCVALSGAQGSSTEELISRSKKNIRLLSSHISTCFTPNWSYLCLFSIHHPPHFDCSCESFPKWSEQHSPSKSAYGTVVGFSHERWNLYILPTSEMLQHHFKFWIGVFSAPN